MRCSGKKNKKKTKTCSQTKTHCPASCQLHTSRPLNHNVTLHSLCRHATDTALDSSRHGNRPLPDLLHSSDNFLFCFRAVLQCYMFGFEGPLDLTPPHNTGRGSCDMGPFHTTVPTVLTGHCLSHSAAKGYLALR